MKIAIDGVSTDDGMFHLDTPSSMNNRLIVEPYVKEALRAKIQNGFATPDQKTTLKGLKIYLNAKLNDGTFIRAGSVAYIREELLHTAQWAQKKYESAATGDKQFLIVDLANIEFIVPAEPVLKFTGESSDT